MQILPIHTPLIRAGDDLCSVLRDHFDIKTGDILVLSSKVAAVAEHAAINLADLRISEEAQKWSKKTGRDSAFCEAVLMETKRLNGEVLGAVHGAMLTALQPNGMTQGKIFTPNAGLDQSNIDEGFAIGWPVHPVSTAQKISDALHVPVIISDSTVAIGRPGVTAFALVTCGMEPLGKAIGQTDLFGHPLTITMEAVADQLAVMANTVMGNAGQSNPAAIIRDHGIAFSDYCGWVAGMKPEDDLFTGIMNVSEGTKGTEV